MITRIKSIDIQGFRSFSSPGNLPIDSDVVLIYGQNGAGKTSLMSAIEFAVSGEVSDLSKYGDDYPRCLTNVNWKSPVHVKLTVESDNNEQKDTEKRIDGRTVNTSGSLKLTKEDARFFAERCYLSQPRLNRLLEAYQFTDKENPEQLLVRFVRELLGLDLLENITAGLYEAGDIRRLENGCASLSRLRQEQTNIQVSVRELESLLRANGTEVERTARTAKMLFEAIGDPQSNTIWNTTNVKALREKLLQSLVLQPLRALQEKQGRLNRIVGFLQDVDAKTISERKDSQNSRLVAIQTRRATIEESLNAILTRKTDDESDIQRILQALPDDSSILSNIAILESEIQKSLRNYQEHSKQQSDAVKELDTQKLHIQSLNTELQQLSSVSSGRVDEQRRQFELLQSVVNRIHGDNCPVCDRNYSEVNPQGLKAKIEAEIAKLGVDIKSFEISAKRKAELQDALNVGKRKTEAMEKRLSALDAQLKTLKRGEEQARPILAELEQHKAARTELENLINENNNVQNQLKAIEVQVRQNNEAAEEISRLAQDLNISKPEQPTKTLDLVEIVTRELRFKLENLETLSRQQQQLSVALSEAEAVLADADRTQKRWNDAKERLDTINKKLEDVDVVIKHGRKLSQAAANAKTQLLHQIFNDTLNSLWKKLFARLARFEQFVPQLAEPVLYRGKIQTRITGNMTGVSPFANFAAVSSMGNLNTAALSLFLALNLVEKPRHKILLLDDPVQNMDDVHVMQFASLIRAIAYQGKRQVVLAVHERALFDYLCLELGPSCEGDSLSTVEISRDVGPGGSRLSHERRSWKPDALKFGT